MLFKTLSESVRDVDQKDGVVTAYLSAFGNEDAHGDIIEPGAYTKTIRERGPGGSNRIKILWQHSPWEPIGRPLELEEDEHGLLARFKISATTLGRDALILYDDGVLTEHSVGIDILRRSEEDRRRIEEIRLWEGSPVTWGANPLTPTLDVKALLGSDTGVVVERRAKEHIDKMRRALRRPLSDHTAEQIEIALGVLEDHLQTLHHSLRSAPDTPAPDEGESTRTGDAPQEDDLTSDSLDEVTQLLATFESNLLRP